MSLLKFVFSMAVDAEGEYHISDEIWHRRNGKTKKSRRGGRIVQLQYCVMKKNPKATYCCLSLDHKHEVALLGGISERRSKREVVGYH